MDSITQSFIEGMNIDQSRKMQAMQQQQQAMAMAGNLMQMRAAQVQQKKQTAINEAMKNLPTDISDPANRTAFIQKLAALGHPEAVKMVMALPTEKIIPAGSNISETNQVTGVRTNIPGPPQNVPDAVRSFELQAFGKEVPELRGKPVYEAKKQAMARLTATSAPLKVYDMNGNVTRETFANEQGGFDLKPGETTKAPIARQPYMDAKGNTVLVDTASPAAQGIIDRGKLKTAFVVAGETKIPPYTSNANLPPGVMINRKTGQLVEYDPETNSVHPYKPGVGISKASLDWQAMKKSAQTINGPAFKRIIDNAEILTVGVKNPQTGEMSKPELDQVAELRDKIPDRWLSKINKDFQGFNKIDQMIAYKVSDPNVARFISKVMANTDTLANVYAGGGTVTSDEKMKFAKELFEAALSKEAFRAKMDVHKESVLDRARKYSEPNPAGITNAPNSNMPAFDIKVPKGAQTGKFNGVPSYSTDGGKTIFDMAGKRMK